MDIQIAFHKDDIVKPTMTNLLFGRSVTCHFLIRRIDMKSIPSDETEAAEWLQELFRFKDTLQDSFYTHGDFFTGSGLKPIEPVSKHLNYKKLLKQIIANLTC